MINDIKNRKTALINISRNASFADIKKEIDETISFDNELNYDDFNLDVDIDYDYDHYTDPTPTISFCYWRKLTDGEIELQRKEEEKERLRQEKEAQKEKERKKKEKLLHEENELKLYQKLKKKFEK